MSKKNRSDVIERASENTEIVQIDVLKPSKRRIVTFAAIVLLGIFVFAGCKSGIWERFVSFAIGKGLASNESAETGESIHEKETLEETEADSVKEIASDATDSESDSLAESVLEESEAITVDLSQSDKGSFYILDEYGNEVDAETISDARFEGAKEYYSDSPVVLILHSHTSEQYYDADSSVAIHAITKTVVAVGDRISSRLNKSGIPTVHCTVIHDGDSKVDSYAKSSETIKTMLEIYPTIEYVIDLHRASMFDDDGRCVKTLSLVGSAQVRMLVDSESGGEQPLILAALIREKLNSRDARVAMPVIYSGGLPLGGASPCFMKLEVGSYGNLTSEAVTAGELFADAFAAVVKGK